MEKSSFFNSIKKDRTYKAEDFAKYFSNFIGNGVFAKHGQALAVTVGEGMQVIIGVGSAFINGYAYENTTSLTLDIDVADGVLRRIDRLVLRWSLQDRSIRAVLLKGQPASEPAAVELTRNSEIYELAIADIFVGKGVIEITQAAVTDLRPDKELCGFVAHVVQDFDVGGMYSQFEAAFHTFMEGVQGTLAGDVAGNLLNKINAVENSVANIKTNEYVTATLSASAWTQESSSYVQSVTVNSLGGMMALIDLLMSDTANDDALNAYRNLIRAKRVGNAIKFFSPIAISVAIPLKMLLFKGTGDDMFLMKYEKGEKDKTVLLPSYTGTSFQTLSQVNGRITVATDVITMLYTNASASSMSGFYTTVDLTNYNTLEFALQVDEITSNQILIPYAGVFSTVPTTGMAPITQFIASVGIIPSPNVVMYSVDISNINGNRMIGLLGGTKGRCVGIVLRR